MIRSRCLFMIPIVLLSIACARPRSIFVPEHLKGCSVPSFSLAAGDQKSVLVQCGRSPNDSVELWIESYRAKGYQASEIKTIESRCGSVFSMSLRRDPIFIQIVGGPLLAGVCDDGRLYSVRIQKSRLKSAPEKWRVEMHLRPSDFLLDENSGPYGIEN